MNVEQKNENSMISLAKLSLYFKYEANLHRGFSQYFVFYHFIKKQLFYAQYFKFKNNPYH